MNDVTRTSGASSVRWSETRGVSSTEVHAPDVELPALEGAAGEQEVRAFLAATQQRLSEFSAAMGDPETLLMAMSNAVERSGMNVNRAQVGASQQSRQVHLAQQAEAARKASEEQKTAATWGLIAKIAAYVGAAVGVVASIALAVVTAGAGAAGVAAIVGAVVGATASGVSLAGQITGDVLSEAMKNDPALAARINGGFQIAAAVLGMVAAVAGLIANPLNVLNVIGQSATLAGNLGTTTLQSLQLANVELPPWAGPLFAAIAAAGALTASASALTSGASSAATATRGAASTIRTVNAVTRGATDIAQGTATIVGAVHTHDADLARVEARQHGEAARKVMEAIGELAEELRELAESIGRQRSRTVEMGQQKSQARAQLAHNMLRA